MCASAAHEQCVNSRTQPRAPHRTGTHATNTGGCGLCVRSHLRLQIAPPHASSSAAEAKATLRRAPAGTSHAPMPHLRSHRHAELHAGAGGPAATSSRLQSLTERLCWPVGRIGVHREVGRGCESNCSTRPENGARAGWEGAQHT
eukprot:scaffold14854_cov129-Isochrysis_galbana.AAC.1